MKDIGIKLKEKREENGVSIEEAAEDLKMRPNQIISIEEGRREDFDDVFYLKYFIRDYAKYLGLDSDSLVDEFNEYLFDFTSKIPVEEIANAKKNKQEAEKNVISPYTINKKSNIFSLKYLIIITIIFLLIITSYFVISKFEGNNFSDSDITYVIRR